MKVLAVILLVVAAVHARSTGLQRAAASLGENPSVVHIRLAVSTSGYLNSCVGSLISDKWVLTSKQCIQNYRFLWFRFGVVDVVKPETVTENGVVTTHPTANLALININRDIEITDNVAPIALADSDELADSGKVCAFGENDNNGPGERLQCVNVSIKEAGGLIEAASDEGKASQYDSGAALVADGKQVGVLVDWNNENGASFLKVTDYKDWIKSVTGL